MLELVQLVYLQLILPGTQATQAAPLVSPGNPKQLVLSVAYQTKEPLNMDSITPPP